MTGDKTYRKPNHLAGCTRVSPGCENCSDLDNLRTRVQQVLSLTTGQNRSLYGLDFEAGMVKALCAVHAILDPGSSFDDVFYRVIDAEHRPNTQGQEVEA